MFFILLAIMALGFAQSMYALDAADGESGGGVVVANSLIQALLGSVISFLSLDSDIVIDSLDLPISIRQTAVSVIHSD